jgi:hypothetical protein
MSTADKQQRRRKYRKGVYSLVCLFKKIFKTGSHYVTWAGLELVTLPPQLPTCRDYRRAPPHLVCYFLKVETDGMAIRKIEEILRIHNPQ